MFIKSVLNKFMITDYFYFTGQVDQIRRSSRSVCTNIVESWYNRKYPKSFISKLIDSAGESGETEVWIEFSFEFKYLNLEQKNRLLTKYSEVGKMLNPKSSLSPAFGGIAEGRYVPTCPPQHSYEVAGRDYRG